ncbi:MAG TPA: hypothetical protein VFW11_06635 [Cyclobacteriaceae bacterium]|nr:hypothetical protein [Cyclobacteriaceae bacterium]
MKILKRIGIILGAFLILALLFTVWYRATFSMEMAKEFEVNEAVDMQQRVLIATQGSEFKNAVVHGLVENLKDRPVYIKVIDISHLKAVHANEWAVIVIIHTWEYQKPPAPVKEFADQVQSNENIVMLATSGDGGFKLEGFDAISSASKQSEVNTEVKTLLAKIERILNH